jgi:hypothetical protein
VRKHAPCLILLVPPGVTEALKTRKAKEYEAQCTSDLMRIVDLVRGELTGLQRATLGEHQVILSCVCCSVLLFEGWSAAVVTWSAAVGSNVLIRVP